MSEQLDLFGKPGEISFDQAVSIYRELEGDLLRGRSHKYDFQRLSTFFGKMDLHMITAHDVTRYRAWRKHENPDLRESTINREHTRFTRIMNAFKEWKRLGRMGAYDFSALILPLENPGELVSKASEKLYRRNLIVTPEMFFKFCDYAHPNIRRICTVAILTLLRKKDIELLKDENLNRALEQVSGIQSKTGLPYDVPAPLTIRILFNQAKMEERKYVCDFTNFRRLFIRARNESGVYFQFRDLRRSGATQLLVDGIDIRTIQKLLGHAEIQTTEIYLNPSTKVAKEAGKKLENAYITTANPVELEFCSN